MGERPNHHVDRSGEPVTCTGNHRAERGIYDAKSAMSEERETPDIDGYKGSSRVM